MATEETETKQYLRREAAKLERLCGVPFAVIANPANTQSAIGRADCDLIINNVLYFHLEIKKEGEGLSLSQEVFFEEARYGQWQLCVAGKVGVDEFLARLVPQLRRLLPGYQAKMSATLDAIDDKFAEYLNVKRRYADAAAKRPKRQSPGSQ